MHVEAPRRIVANDYGRGIGIFLVVLGHVLIGLDNHGILTESSTPSALRLSRGVVGWIYTFHMPLFFFLSGTLIERSVRKPAGEFFSSRLRTIAWPYLVWSLLQESLREVTDISEGSAADWWRILYRPMMQFWFLYVLFFLSLAYYAARRLDIPRVGVFLIAAVLHYGHLYTDLPTELREFSWVYHEFCRHSLYLAAGALAAEYFDRNRIASVGWVTARLLTAAAGSTLLAVCVACEWPVDRALLAFVGILSSLAVASVLAQYRAASFLEQWGLLSLPIYVAHTIASAAIRTLLLRCGVYNPATHIALQLAAGLYGPIALSEICHKLKCDWLFTLRSTPS